jgi:hypothetical protein
MPATTPPYIFTQGIPDNIYLPADGQGVEYTTILNIGLSGTLSLENCYDKYGVLWRWSTFESGASANTNLLALGIDSSTNSSGLCALSSTRVPFPSSWATTTCFSDASNIPVSLTPQYGTYPKTWQNERPLSAELFNPVAVNTICSAVSITFTLSTDLWSDSHTVPLSVGNSHIFELSLLENGSTALTLSRNQATILTLNATSSGSCYDVATATFNDWVISETKQLTSYPPPIISIYTPNRFVLSGSVINFENISTSLELVTGLNINLDDGKSIFLSGNNINNSFSVSYDILGYKTIHVTVLPDYNGLTLTQSFPNIIQVVENYDDVSPTEYRSQLTPISLPWSTPPVVYSNDWVTEDNINSCFKKFYDNLDYLESRGRVYNSNVTDYFGYLGVQPLDSELNRSRCLRWTWQDLDCLNSNLPYTVTWADVLSSSIPGLRGVWTSNALSGSCGTWFDNRPRARDVSISCYQKYCTEWKWISRKLETAAIPITWSQSVSGGQYQKRWYYEPCESEDRSIDISCSTGVWNVNIPKLDTYYDPIANPYRQPRCILTGIASKNNQIYLTRKIQLLLLTKEYNYGTNFLPRLYSNLKNICIDSQDKIYVLDSTQSRVDVYTYQTGTPGEDWELFTSWGGVGTAGSNIRFFNPNDIHIDQLDNVWVCDTGNNVVKHYSNSGTWIKTLRDDVFKDNPPTSLCVDSQKNVHILTGKEIRIYTYDGAFVGIYKHDEIEGAIKINSSHNREVVYVISQTQAGKYFRNGIFFGYIIEEKQNVTNINAIYQDEFRNILITTDDKVLKYPDLMLLERIKDTLPTSYWTLQDLYIHKNEYIQSWVYTKSFQRLWDNIEIFRNTLYFSSGNCKSYVGPIHEKEKMVIGQNEIVTSTVVNRVLGYLWENLYTLIDYFDPDCRN